MIEKTVDEVYDANAAIRAKLRDLVDSLSDGQVNAVPDGEKWSIANIVEHLTKVEAGATRICTRLLSKAKDNGTMGDGKVRITSNFVEKGNEIGTIKVEAPDIVKPTDGKSIAESMDAFGTNAEALEALKTVFETVDSSEPTFPHPFFGGLSAGEWLVMIGAHEARHLKQIRRLVEKL